MPFLTLHAVQTIPYANLNRDDLGAPKTLTFGGATRIRISSQSLGRPLREFVEESTGIEAVRTRRIATLVKDALITRGWDDELAAAAAAQVLDSVAKKSKTDKVGLALDDKGTKSLLFVPASTGEKLADLCETYRNEVEKAAQSSAKNPKPGVPAAEVIDIIKSINGSIALFGRMLSELPGAGVDAARQMAHGFTTHAARRQPDFFTAVDDVTHDSDESGSGHMNHAEYATGVFYRYAVLDLDELLNDTHLAGDTTTARALVDAFTRGFIRILPQAKKNGTAPHTIPDLVHFTVRTDQPVNYAAAFERPVQADEGGGFAAPSRLALARYASAVNRLVGTDDVAYSGHATIADGENLTGLGDRADSFKELTAAAVDALFGPYNA
ncbi:type I-E CRISPR-associated protein Cas7/Cse4/CasC [Streptomyces sannanensis]|uniref:Type I-E CRISPR-associated protein Cas7/Cse4/CasC n=1 Tax=Streptomyces sannanensis TaxID=285536 RepID=A0ABP6SMQ0_9ACTN